MAIREAFVVPFSHMENCLFCKFVRSEIPCEKVYENEHVLAFLDIHPLNEGHVLVIPKVHSENILDIPEERFAEVMRVVRLLAPIIKDVTGADGINIHSNHGKEAGQAVFHLHMHIIPRHAGDGYLHWHRNESLPTHLKETQGKILEALKKD